MTVNAHHYTQAGHSNVYLLTGYQPTIINGAPSLTVMVKEPDKLHRLIKRTLKKPGAGDLKHYFAKEGRAWKLITSCKLDDPGPAWFKPQPVCRIYK